METYIVDTRRVRRESFYDEGESVFLMVLQTSLFSSVTYEYMPRTHGGARTVFIAKM